MSIDRREGGAIGVTESQLSVIRRYIDLALLGGVPATF